MQFKTTTESTESRERNGTTGTGTDSERSYMRHTSNSEKRQKNRNRTQQIKTSFVNTRKSTNHNTSAITNNSSKADGFVGDQTIKSLAATYMNFNDLKVNEDFSKERRSHSPIPVS